MTIHAHDCILPYGSVIDLLITTESAARIVTVSATGQVTALEIASGSVNANATVIVTKIGLLAATEMVAAEEATEDLEVVAGVVAGVAAEAAAEEAGGQTVTAMATATATTTATGMAWTGRWRSVWDCKRTFSVELASLLWQALKPPALSALVYTVRPSL